MNVCTMSDCAGDEEQLILVRAVTAKPPIKLNFYLLVNICGCIDSSWEQVIIAALCLCFGYEWRSCCWCCAVTTVMDQTDVRSFLSLYVVVDTLECRKKTACGEVAQRPEEEQWRRADGLKHSSVSLKLPRPDQNVFYSTLRWVCAIQTPF